MLAQPTPYGPNSFHFNAYSDYDFQTDICNFSFYSRHKQVNNYIYVQLYTVLILLLISLLCVYNFCSILRIIHNFNIS